MSRQSDDASTIIQLPPRQWLIGADIEHVRGTSNFQLDDVQIVAGDDLAIWPVQSSDGQIAGCLIGTPIDLLEGGIVKGHQVLPEHAKLSQTPDDDQTVLAWLARYAGAFYAIIRRSGATELYLSAANSCVFDTESGRVGTTAATILSPAAYSARLDHTLIQKLSVNNDGWLPGPLTAHHGIQRLLPNHALNLSTLKTRRIWKGATRAGTEPEILIRRIFEIAARTMTSTAYSHHLALALSAGRDSRAVLAMAVAAHLKPELFTIAHPGADLDIRTARDLAEILGLQHTVIAPKFANDADQMQWVHRNGNVVGGINRKLHPTLQAFDSRTAILAGSFGEVGRGYYWRNLADAHADISGRSLFGRFGLPQDHRLSAMLDDWLAGVGTTDKLQILDLAYIEHRLGGWAAPQQTADPTICFHPGPLQNLEVFDCLLSLPDEWRWHGRWIDEIIQTHCPALADTPFNKYRQPWRNALALGGKLLSPTRVRRHVRQWFAD